MDFKTSSVHREEVQISARRNETLYALKPEYYLIFGFYFVQNGLLTKYVYMNYNFSWELLCEFLSQSHEGRKQ